MQATHWKILVRRALLSYSLVLRQDLSASCAWLIASFVSWTVISGKVPRTLPVPGSVTRHRSGAVDMAEVETTD